MLLFMYSDDPGIVHVWFDPVYFHVLLLYSSKLWFLVDSIILLSNFVFAPVFPGLYWLFLYSSLPLKDNMKIVLVLLVWWEGRIYIKKVSIKSSKNNVGKIIMMFWLRYIRLYLSIVSLHQYFFLFVLVNTFCKELPLWTDLF